MGLFEHSLILKNDDTLWGTGYNGYGQLGLGDTTNRTTFTQITTNTNDIKSVYYGEYHTLILKNDGTLWGCGRNTEGQLGLGDTTNRKTFTEIITNADDIKSVYCGGYHTFILKNNGTLWGTGRNSSGQLGLGDGNNRTTFTEITTNVDDIKTINCGEYYTFILKNDGTLWSCGENDYGQLGLGDKTSKTTFTKITTNTDDIKSVCCGFYQTFILKNDGTLWSCGRNNCGQLGLGDGYERTTFTEITTNADDVKMVDCGKYHTLILKNDGTLWSCGDNYEGELGLGDSNNRDTFTEITTNTDNIKSIHCGAYNTFILKNDSILWCTGYNYYGALGLGNTDYKYTFTEITTNADDIKSLPNQYKDIPFTTKIYDLNTGLIETLDTNNFRNIPVNKFEKIKVLYTNPAGTYINCLISFDQKQTWKTFNGTSWSTISDTTPSNILLNGMDISKVNKLDKNKLIAGGFTGDIDFRIAMKTNDNTVTPSIIKIYILYC